MYSLKFIFLFAFIYSCSDVSSKVQSPIELYATSPDGIIKLELSDEYLLYADVDCLDLNSELDIVKKITDSKFQKSIAMMDALPSPRSKCDSFKILDLYPSKTIKNLVHYHLLAGPSAYKQNKEKQFFYSILSNRDETIVGSFFLDVPDLKEMDKIFSEIFVFKYYTRTQINKLGTLKNLDEVETINTMDFQKTLAAVTDSQSSKMDKSEELGLITIYASAEAFELGKLIVEDLGFNPFVSSAVINNLQRKLSPQ